MEISDNKLKLEDHSQSQKIGSLLSLLGNDGNNFSLWAYGANLSPKHKARSGKLKLLSYAQKILIEENMMSNEGNPHSTRWCGCRSQYGKTPTIQINDNPLLSSAALANTQSCKNVWACPRCAPKIAAMRGKEIKLALAWADDNRYIPVMLTLTASHHDEMSLEWFKEQFKRAWRYFIGGKGWQALRAKYGLERWIKAVEPLRSRFYGWHYHQHILFLIPRSLISSQENFNPQDIEARWHKALARVGLYGNEHAFDWSANQNVGDRYLSKLGAIGNDAKQDYELSGTMNKTRGNERAGFTMWDMLKSASRGNPLMRSYWVEGVKAMTGEKWITWSNGLKAEIGLDELADSELNLDDIQSEKMQDLHQLTSEQIETIRAYRANWFIENVAARSRSKEVVELVLDRLRNMMLSGHYPHEIRERLGVLRDELKRQRANLSFSERFVSDENKKLDYERYFGNRIKAIESELDSLQANYLSLGDSLHDEYKLSETV